ncbi:hypothetical protein GCM10018987_54650 [Streptomyces cremeus]
MEKPAADESSVRRACGDRRPPPARFGYRSSSSPASGAGGSCHVRVCKGDRRRRDGPGRGLITAEASSLK